MKPTGFTGGRAGPLTLVLRATFVGAAGFAFGVSFGVAAAFAFAFAAAFAFAFAVAVGVGVGVAVGVGVRVGVGTTAATCTTAVELLFAPTFWSACCAAIRAVLVIVPEAVVLTTIATVADSPTSRVPSAHVIVVVPLQLPRVVVTETSVSPAGSTSSNATQVATPGPWLVTTDV